MTRQLITNSQTAVIRERTQHRVNKMGLAVVILHNNPDTFFTISSLKEAMFNLHGISITNSYANHLLITLSGNRSDVVASKQRDAAIRRKITKADRAKFGWPKTYDFKYKANPNGNAATRPALSRPVVQLITRAEFV